MEGLSAWASSPSDTPGVGETQSSPLKFTTHRCIKAKILDDICAGGIRDMKRIFGGNHTTHRDGTNSRTHTHKHPHNRLTTVEESSRSLFDDANEQHILQE